MATIETTKSATGTLIILLGAAVFLNYVDRGAIGIAAPLAAWLTGKSRATRWRRSTTQ